MKTRLIVISSAALTLGATAATTPAAPPTKTLANLASAWQGESNAKLRYQLFAEKAEQEGEKQAARLFRATSKAEEIHAASFSNIHRPCPPSLIGVADAALNTKFSRP